MKWIKFMERLPDVNVPFKLKCNLNGEVTTVKYHIQDFKEASPFITLSFKVHEGEFRGARYPVSLNDEWAPYEEK